MSDRETDRKMTKKAILDQCKRNKLYTTPALNDVLYLHFQGFPKIENLEEYTGLKCLWLESNAITQIEGLDQQPKLKSLFLQNNLITKIENLDNCKELDTLVLSHNYIKSLDNCCSEYLPVLNTLNISHNQLRDVAGLEILKHCNNVSILDLSFNKIDDIMVIKVLGEMPSLHVLTMTGNPVVNSVTNYRKTMILECKSLTYLDSRPVFPRDRACAEAWKGGGFAAEKREHEQWNREERRKIRRSVNALLVKVRGDSTLLNSSDDEKEESKESKDEPSEGQAQPVNEESAMDIYEENQKELIEMYEMEQQAYNAMMNDAVETVEAEPQKPPTKAAMIQQIRKEERIEQQKDELQKMLDISSDQDRILQMLQMNRNIEENIFGASKKVDEPKKVLIEEIFDEAPKAAAQQKVSFKIGVEEIPVRDEEPFANEMESMLWFEDEPASTQNDESSLDYQLTNLPDVVTETFAEDFSTAPESLTNAEDFTKVLELCHEKQKDAMQLCFLNDNEKLVQIYDEAVEQKLVQESDRRQLAEIEGMFEDDDDDDASPGFCPDLDGILMVRKLDIVSGFEDFEEEDDEEVLEFSHIELSEVKQTAENLIDGVIKSLEDMPL